MINCLCALFYMAVSGYTLFSLVATNYDEEATKPLNVSSEFTYKIRDLALKPYTDIKV